MLAHYFVVIKPPMMRFEYKYHTYFLKNKKNVSIFDSTILRIYFWLHEKYIELH